MSGRVIVPDAPADADGLLAGVLVSLVDRVGAALVADVDAPSAPLLFGHDFGSVGVAACPAAALVDAAARDAFGLHDVVCVVSGGWAADAAGLDGRPSEAADRRRVVVMVAVSLDGCVGLVFDGAGWSWSADVAGRVVDSVRGVGVLKPWGPWVPPVPRPDDDERGGR